MNRVAAMVMRTGEGADRALDAIRAAPSAVRDAVTPRRHRHAGFAAAVLALLLYLLAIGDVVARLRSQPTRTAGAGLVEVIPDWDGRLFRARAPYVFEPVLAVHPFPQLTVLLSPVNVVLGGLLALLVGLNLAVASHAVATAPSCRRTGYGRLLGAAPALLTGIACCVPTFLIVLGSSTAALLLPVVTPLRSLFYPLSLLLLATTLVWGTRRR